MVLKTIPVLNTALLALALIACQSSPEQEQNSAPKQVKVGAQLLLEHHLDELEGVRVGLVMNPTARVEGRHMLDTLMALDVNVTALFAPEHGFRGEAGAGEVIEDGIDQETGLPVHSLYGDTRKPTSEMLEGVDLLLFDMQDVGARFYTYNVTLGLVLEAAAESEVAVWVLDRPNPAGGEYVAGWMLEDEYKSFVGAYPIPMAHGMTLGELANMMIGENWIEYETPPDLRVIEMDNWERSMKWTETGLEWYPPSPNLPTFEHAYLYLGTVLFEGTSISEGRGTDDPFLTIGSPATEIPEADLNRFSKWYPQVDIERAEFTPHSIPGKSLNPKYEGEKCYGVSLSVKEYEGLHPVTFGVELLELMLESTEGSTARYFLYNLAGSKEVLDFTTDWDEEIQAFRQNREEYLLY